MIEYRTSPEVTNPALNELFTAAWGEVCAFEGERLVGFVNTAWDGGLRAFPLDTTVHPDVQRTGNGSTPVEHALKLSRERGCHHMHVDFEPHLEHFYASCAFRPALAGVVKLS